MSIIQGLRETPRDVREWDRVFQALNRAIRRVGAQTQIDAEATLTTRATTNLGNVVSRLTDAGKAANQEFLPFVNTGNLLSVQNVKPLTATADAVTASITVAAHTLQFAHKLVSYGAGSITGLSPNTDYLVFADDPDYLGGAVAYAATTNQQTLTAAPGRYFVGAIRTAVSANQVSIAAATSANPIVFTSATAHGWNTGQSVTFAALPGDFGTNLNGTTRQITRVSDTQFSVAVNGSAYVAYTSGGTATRVSTPTDGGGGGGGGWVFGEFIP